MSAVGERKFHRALPDERRRELVAATLRSLVAHGREGLSVRRIAAEAGVSVGLLNHHFPGIDALVAQAYEHLATELTWGITEAMRAAGPSPRARLLACLEASFFQPAVNPRLLSAWLVFWGMMRYSPAIQAAHDRTYQALREVLEGLLADLFAEAGLTGCDTRRAAVGLSAMLDGLWLEWCLNEASFTPRDGVAICQEWVDALCRRA